MNSKPIFALSALTAIVSLGFSQGALAEGFYFGLFGGVSSVDLSKSDIDAFYVNQARTSPSFSVASLSSTIDDSTNTWGLQIGYGWNSYVAVEIGYVDFGRAFYDAQYTVAFDAVPVGTGPITFSSSFSHTTLQSSGPTLAVLGMLPLGEKFDVFGRAGIIFSDTRVSYTRENDFLEEDKGEDKDLLFGAGGSWNINEDYALRLEYQRFLDVGDEKTGEADIDLIAVSVLFR